MIALGSDHGGYLLKKAIKKYLDENKIEYTDFGTNDEASVDYAPIAAKVAHFIADGKAEKGILCCGTGIGMSIAANKVKGIRAAVCANAYCAEITRHRNNAHELNALRVAALDDGHSINRGATCRQHRIKHDDFTLINIKRKFAVVFHRLERLGVTVKADMADLSCRYKRKNTVNHSETCSQDWNKSKLTSGNHFCSCLRNRRFNCCFFQRKVASSFIAKQHCNFTDKLAKFF